MIVRQMLVIIGNVREENIGNGILEMPEFGGLALLTVLEGLTREEQGLWSRVGGGSQGQKSEAQANEGPALARLSPFFGLRSEGSVTTADFVQGTTGTSRLSPVSPFAGFSWFPAVVDEMTRCHSIATFLHTPDRAAEDMAS
jgi:hypothetical protein